MSTSDVSTEADGGCWLEHGAAAERVLFYGRTLESHADCLMRALSPGECRWPNYQSADTEKWLAHHLAWSQDSRALEKTKRKDIPLFDREADSGTAILGGEAFDW